MLAAVVAVLLTAAPAPSVKLAATGFKSINLPDQQGTFFSDYFAEQLGRATGYPVTTATEVSGLLGLERQKQLLGCGDDSNSCAAELLGALGADAIVTGSAAKVGESFAITLKVSATR